MSAPSSSSPLQSMKAMAVEEMIEPMDAKTLDAAIENGPSAQEAHTQASIEESQHVLSNLMASIGAASTSTELTSLDTQSGALTTISSNSSAASLNDTNLESIVQMSTNFRNLPIEIRQMIWKFVSTQVRFVDLRVFFKYPNFWNDYSIYDAQYRSYSNVPPILHVNRESREWGLKHYKLAYGTDNFPPQIYVNWDVDIICPILDHRYMTSCPGCITYFQLPDAWRATLTTKWAQPQRIAIPIDPKKPEMEMHGQDLESRWCSFGEIMKMIRLGNTKEVFFYPKLPILDHPRSGSDRGFRLEPVKPPVLSFEEMKSPAPLEDKHKERHKKLLKTGQELFRIDKLYHQTMRIVVHRKLAPLVKKAVAQLEGPERAEMCSCGVIHL